MILQQKRAVTMPTDILDSDMLCCPKCKGGLQHETERFTCLTCRQSYPVVDNIPQLFWNSEWGESKQDVTDAMKAFYEVYPFPNYDDFDSAGTLVEKARKRIFAKLLDDQIPFGTKIIECGCGTGQLTNFLSIAGRTVIGADMCMNSLRMAQGFKERNDLKRARFFQMNLFRPCFKPGQFDLVISNGVLHHTADPFLAFRTISTLVKPKGYILIGLYHKYGRLTTDIRRGILKMTRDRVNLDRRMSENISAARKKSWYMDQYKNPHESKHTVEEVLGWLKQTGFTFVKSIPKTVPFESFSESEKLFAPDALGSWLSRSLVEMGMAVTACRDGGLFIVIARKNA
jgi:SAM-dependent methyltransferase/uncharacterized protein YbaR (Trm112 family)